MPGVKVHEGESIDKALKQFKKQCEKSGILTEIKKREYYEKPSVKRKKKDTRRAQKAHARPESLNLDILIP